MALLRCTPQVDCGGWHTSAIRPNGTLVCWGWNAQGQSTPPIGTFTQVDAGTGRIVEQRALPQVASIVVAPKINGDLYLASEDGRVQRVEPLARPTMTEETTAAAPAGRGKGGLGAPALKGAPAATDAPAAPAAGGAQAIPATQTLNPRPR